MERKPEPFKINVEDLFQKAFDPLNFRGLPFPVLLGRSFRDGVDVSDFTGIGQNKKARSQAEQRQRQNAVARTLRQEQRSNESLSRLILGGVAFEIPVLVSIAGTKNIVSTPVAGRNFSVKEIISIEDYKINFRGFLSEPGVTDAGGGINLRKSAFPENKLRELVLDIWQVNRDIEVESDFLRMFSVNRVVITDLSFPELAGYAGVIPFEMNALSDVPVELTLTKRGSASNLPN
jgi:hypothetical protein